MIETHPLKNFVIFFQTVLRFVLSRNINTSGFKNFFDSKFVVKLNEANLVTNRDCETVEHHVIENKEEIEKCKRFINFFISKNCFSYNGAHNYVIFEMIYNSFKR